MEACDQIHHLGHRPKRLVASVLVLIDNELIRILHTSRTERGTSALLVRAKYHSDEIEQLAVRCVEVCFGDVVSLSRPVDGIVCLGIQFLFGMVFELIIIEVHKVEY